MFLLRCEHAHSRRWAERVPATYSSQYLLRQLCNAAKDLRCSRIVWPSDSRRTLSYTSAASAYSNWINLYKLSWPWLALSFSRQCQPSTSLLVRTGWRKTDQVARWWSWSTGAPCTADAVQRAGRRTQYARSGTRRQWRLQVKMAMPLFDDTHGWRARRTCTHTVTDCLDVLPNSLRHDCFEGASVRR